MSDVTYGMKGRVSLPVEAAEAKVREALAGEGFGVLTEIDVAATLKTKLDLDVPPYKILGACNPTLASQALDLEQDIGLLLPCNVVVYEDGDGSVVGILDPGIMVDLTTNPAVKPVADQAKQALERVLAAVTG
ncbi:MAG: DUF302 domain-containing protein [Acidimicrobiia bacterium]